MLEALDLPVQCAWQIFVASCELGCRSHKVGCVESVLLGAQVSVVRLVVVLDSDSCNVRVVLRRSRRWVLLVVRRELLVVGLLVKVAVVVGLLLVLVQVLMEVLRVTIALSPL